MTKIEKALPQTINVELGEETIEISKLPLGKYAQLMLALKNMPTSVMSEFQTIDTENDEATIQAVFGLFGQAWGQVLDILAIGSGIEKDRIENDPTIGLDGGVALFLAIYEVNNLGKVIKQVKNAMNRPAK